MKLQRFIGKNTKTVLDEIRATLGEDALIVSNTKIGSKTEIIAAREETPISHKNQRSDEYPPESPVRFGAILDESKVIHTNREEDDPWQFLKNIQNEIKEIKNTISDLPLLPAHESKQKEASEAPSSALGSRERKLTHKLNSEKGTHIIWGERMSGKSSLISDLLSAAAPENDVVALVRLPHLYSFCDPHLAEVASRHNLNLTYLNARQSDWRLSGGLSEEEGLTVVEGDLSMLSQFQERDHPLWRVKAHHYSIVKDKEQHELISELFKNLGIDNLTQI
jgi:hypothetical protein